MIQLPERLKQRGIRFVLLEKGCKKPYQIGWQNKNIEFDSPELIEHLARDGNYGVMGGGNVGGQKLILVDFDNKDVQAECLKKLPETFQVTTGSGMQHLYYFSNGGDSFKLFDAEMNTLADIQGEGKQVVGPNCLHPNGSFYTITYDEREIAFIDYAELKATLMPFDKKPQKEKKEKPIFNCPKDSDDTFLRQVKDRVKIADVLNSLGVSTRNNPTQCPFHDSKGGKCLGYNDETAHCFHCENAWNVFSLVMDSKKVIFKDALVHLADIGKLQTELEESRKRFAEKRKNETGLDIELVKNIKTHITSLKENLDEELQTKELKKREDVEKLREDIKNLIKWGDLIEIDKFIIYPGHEKIYEVIIKGKLIRLEGKEILTQDIFRLKYFEEFGIMLPIIKKMSEVWSQIVTLWYHTKKEIRENLIEHHSEEKEAEEIIVDYVNNATVSTDYIVNDGMITVKDNVIYLPTKIIKRLLKRNSLDKVSMRKLTYCMHEYLYSGSIPLKIDKKSERFWKLKTEKFEITRPALDIQEEEDEEEEEDG